MKNATTKIGILILSILAVTGSVMAFWKLFIEPPRDFESVNLHQKSLREDISKISSTKNRAYNDSLYVVITDKFDVFYGNGFLTDSENDTDLSNFVAIFAATYYDLCEKKFSTPRWGEQGFASILSKLNDLRDLTLTTGYKALQTSGADKLNEIESVINNYKKAKSIASTSTFRSISHARETITAANSYAADLRIGKSDLHDKLLMVKHHIGKSHYLHLERSINNLSKKYKYLEKDTFDEQSRELLSEIENYDNFKSIYERSANDSSPLKSELGNIVSRAHQYYESLIKPVINYTIGDWQPTASPDYNFKAFRSYRNKGVDKSTATMTFTISNCSSFKFYIRSWAEGGYDYVMVGKLNQMPSADNSSSIYASTKSNNSSGSGLSSYQSVEFYNLNPHSEYTIYVVYRKDVNGSKNDDCGYLLLPSNANSR